MFATTDFHQCVDPMIGKRDLKPDKSRSANESGKVRSDDEFLEILHKAVAK